MKFALCLHGLSGGINYKNRKIDHTTGYKCFKKYLLDKYDVDVFLHSYTVDMKNTLCKQYKPKLYKFENNRIFCDEPITSYKNSSYSNWYSYKVVDNLRQLYEKENNFKYDCVIHSRFDVYIEINKNLEEYDMDNIYIYIRL